MTARQAFWQLRWICKANMQRIILRPQQIDKIRCQILFTGIWSIHFLEIFPFSFFSPLPANSKQ